MISSIILIFVVCIGQSVLLFKLGFDLNIILTDGISLFGLSFLFIYLIYIIQRNYHTKIVLNLSNLSTIGLFSALTTLSNFFIAFGAYGNDKEYMTFVSTAIWIKAFIVLAIFTISLMLFWIDQQKIQEERLQRYAIQKEREALHIELNNLQQQLKPHFLFNSLNSINALTLTNPEEARKMIHLLSEFMRGSIRQHQHDSVSFEEELNYIKLYIDIEKVRFGERLNIVYDIEDNTSTIQVPSFILQPLIENSIKYGLYGHTDSVDIKISAKLVDGFLQVTIANPYDPVSSAGAKGTGYGLQSIEKKLTLLFKQRELLRIDKENGQFKATLNIPTS
jgi:sensor histidine kinase YesM